MVMNTKEIRRKPNKERSKVKEHSDKLILLKSKSKLRRKVNTLVASRERLDLFVPSY